MNDYDLLSLPERFLSADSKAIITNTLSLSQSFRIEHTRLLSYIESPTVLQELITPNVQAYEHDGEKAYHLTRDGMLLIVMQLPGREATLFRLSYINAFNEMSRTLYRNDDVQKVMATLSQLTQLEIKEVMLACLSLIK